MGKILGLEQGKSTISVTLNGDSYPFLEQDFYVNGEVEDVTLRRSSYTYYRTNKSGSLKLSARVIQGLLGNQATIELQQLILTVELL